MLALLLLVAALQRPTLGATCAAAPWRLGYDNMPPSNSAPINSIVNIWVAEKQKTAVAWIYKTAAGAYYVQFTGDVSRADARKMGIDPRFTANPFGRQEYGPQPVTTKQLVSIESAVLGSGASLSGCFSHDLSMPRAH